MSSKIDRLRAELSERNEALEQVLSAVWLRRCPRCGQSFAGGPCDDCDAWSGVGSPSEDGWSMDCSRCLCDCREAER